MPSYDSQWDSNSSRVAQGNSGRRHSDSSHTDGAGSVQSDDDGDALTMDSDGSKINTFSPPFVEMRRPCCLNINLPPATSMNPMIAGNIHVTNLTINSSERIQFSI